jgi:hypothetical protein
MLSGEDQSEVPVFKSFKHVSTKPAADYNKIMPLDRKMCNMIPVWTHGASATGPFIAASERRLGLFLRTKDSICDRNDVGAKTFIFRNLLLAAASAYGFCKGGFNLREVFRGDLHFSAPVGILPGAAGEVLLFGFAGQVFLIDHRKAARGGEKEAEGIAAESGG